MPENKTFKIGEDVYDIPSDKVNSFLSKNKDAQELKSFIVGKDTFDVPLDKVEPFLNKYTNAKSLTEKQDNFYGNQVSRLAAANTPLFRTIGDVASILVKGFSSPKIDYQKDAQNTLLKSTESTQEPKPFDLEKKVIKSFLENNDVPIKFTNDKTADFNLEYTGDENLDIQLQDRAITTYENAKKFIDDVQKGNISTEETENIVNDLSKSLVTKATNLQNYNKVANQKDAKEAFTVAGIGLGIINTPQTDKVKELLQASEDIKDLAKTIVSKNINTDVITTQDKINYKEQDISQWDASIQEGIKDYQQLEANLNQTKPDNFIQLGIDYTHAGDIQTKELAKNKLSNKSNVQPFNTIPNAIEYLQDSEMSKLDKETYYYTGVNLKKQAIEQAIAQTKQQIDEVNKSINVNIPEGQKLTKEGEQNLTLLKNIKANLENTYSLQNRILSKLNSDIIGNTEVLQENIAKQEYFNDSYENANSLLGEPTYYVGKDLLRTPLKVKEFAEKLANVATGNTYKSFELNKPLSEFKPEKLEEQIRNSLVVSLDDKNNVNLSVDPIGLFYNTVKFGAESIMLGGTGALASGTGARIFGTGAKQMAKAEIVAASLEGTSSFALKESVFIAVNTLKSKAIPLANWIIDTGIGFITPSAVLFGNEMIENELAKGQKLEDATRIGIIRSAIEGLTERINPLEMNLFKGDIFKGNLRNLGDNVAFRNLLIERGLSPQAFDYLYKFAKVGGIATKNQFYEAIEEDIGLFLNDLYSKSIQEDDASYVNDEPFNLENVVNTTLLTMATMIPVTSITGYKEASSQLQSFQFSRFTVGQNPNLFLSKIGEQLQKEEITEEQALLKAERVKQLNQNYLSVKPQVDRVLASNISENEKKQAITKIFNDNLNYTNLAQSISQQTGAEQFKTLDELDALAEERYEYEQKLNKYENIDTRVQNLQSNKIAQENFIKQIGDTYSAERINNTEDVEILRSNFEQINETLSQLEEEEFPSELAITLQNIADNIQTKISSIEQQTPTTVVDGKAIVEEVKFYGQDEIAKVFGINPDSISKEEETETLITEQEYNDFIDSGNISEVILDTIAEKIKNNEELSEKEIAVFNNKTREINKILQDKQKEEQIPTKDIEAKKADIERRRENSIKKFNEKIGNRDSLLAVYYKQGYDKANLDEVIEYTEDYLGNNREESLKWLNAKYDAELAALEQTPIIQLVVQIPIDIIYEEPSDIKVEEENNSIVNTIGQIENTEERIDGNIKQQGTLLVEASTLGAYQARDFAEITTEEGFTKIEESSNELNPTFLQLHSPTDFPIGKAVKIKVLPIEDSQFLQESKEQFREFINDKALFIPKAQQLEDLNDDNNFREIQVLGENNNVLFTLHALSYIRPNRVVAFLEDENGNQINNLELQYNALKEYRKRLIEKSIQLEQNNLPTEIPAFISGKTVGQPFINKDKTFTNLKSTFKNKDVLDTIQIVEQDGSVDNSKNILKRGDVAIVLPTPNGEKIALKLSSQKLNPTYIDSITSSIKLFTQYRYYQTQRDNQSLAKLDTIAEDIFQSSNIDIRTAEGISQYVQFFVHANSKESDFLKGTQREALSRIPFIDFNSTNLQLSFSRARNFNVPVDENDSFEERLRKIGVRKINLLNARGEINQNLDQFLTEFASYLKDRKVNSDLQFSKKTSSFTLPQLSPTFQILTPSQLEGKGLKQKYSSYKDFITTHATTNLVEQEYTNSQNQKEYIYFVQPNISVEVDNNITKPSEVKEEVVIEPTITPEVISLTDLQQLAADKYNSTTDKIIRNKRLQSTARKITGEKSILKMNEGQRVLMEKYLFTLKSRKERKQEELQETEEERAKNKELIDKAALTFKVDKKTTGIWNSETETFEFYTLKYDRITTGLNDLTAKLSSKPNVLNTWWESLASNQVKNGIVEAQYNLRDLLSKSNGIVDIDPVITPEIFLLKALKGKQFSTTEVNDFTDVYDGWFSEDAENISTYAQGLLEDEIYSEGLFNNLDESEITDVIKDIIFQYPKGIVNSDIEDKIYQEDTNSIDINNLEEEIALDYGINLKIVLNKLSNEIKQYEKQGGITEENTTEIFDERPSDLQEDNENTGNQIVKEIETTTDNSEKDSTFEEYFEEEDINPTQTDLNKTKENTKDCPPF